MTAKDHNNLLGIFILIQGGLTAFIGLFFVLMYGGMGVALVGAGRDDESQMVGGIMLIVGLIIGLVIIVFAALYLFTGFKIRKQQSIGRTLGIVVSILSLFSFPLGTALGIYGLWFLMGDMGKNLYLGQPFAAGYGTAPPPPPNSWQ